MSLRLDFCSREAALFAVMVWHYSGTLPAGRLVCVGVWEDGVFVGVVIFGRGASSEIGSPFGLAQNQVVELCRVALGPHRTATSRIVTVAVRMLRRFCPGLRLLISYADAEVGHVGILYQAMGWLFIGTTNRESLIRIGGRLTHPRTVASRYGTRSIAWLREQVDAETAHVRTLPKFKYVLPLDDAMRQQIAPRVLPYPKRPKEQDPAQSPQGWRVRLAAGRPNSVHGGGHV